MKGARSNLDASGIGLSLSSVTVQEILRSSEIYGTIKTNLQEQITRVGTLDRLQVSAPTSTFHAVNASNINSSSLVASGGLQGATLAVAGTSTLASVSASSLVASGGLQGATLAIAGSANVASLSSIGAISGASLLSNGGLRGWTMNVTGAITAGSILSNGYQTRTGTSGSFGGNQFNFNWTNTDLDLYVDTTRIGKLAYRDNWESGEIIQMQSYNQDNGSNLIGKTRFYQVTDFGPSWFSVSFTPKSNSSRIQIQADAYYQFEGYGNDDYWVDVVDGTSSKFEKHQKFVDNGGGGTRTSVLLPLFCSYNNDNTNTRTIAIRFKSNSNADPINFFGQTSENGGGNNNKWSVMITEVKR